MAMSIEELRKERERIEREREEIERRLAEAERSEREQKASALVVELREMTERIDALKHERQQLLSRIREAAPRLGDFTYASDDYKLSLASARTAMKQPELLDKLVAALAGAELHVEPRAPRFRVFRGLTPVATLNVSARRLTLAVAEPVLDPELVTGAQQLDAQFPGLAMVALASADKKRRVRETISPRMPNGDFATGITFAVVDTGSLDAVLPLALPSMLHVAEYWRRHTSDEEARIFEPWPFETPAAAADAPEKEEPESTEAPMDAAANG